MGTESEVSFMKNMNLNELLNQSNANNLRELIFDQQDNFAKTYIVKSILNEEVKLVFNSSHDAQSFYVDSQLGNRYLKDVQVSYDLLDECALILKPIQSVVSLITYLKKIGKRLQLSFDIEYIQAFTNHHLSMTIHHGEIKNPQCTLYINPDFVSFGCGRLYKLMRNESDFYALNTQIIQIESSVM